MSIRSKYNPGLSLKGLASPDALSRGFTLIELILVILLIGILAVTVTPKFFTSEGFEEYTYQAEVITKLRAIQYRAMQQTTDSYDNCHNIEIQKKKLLLSYCSGGDEVDIDVDHNVEFATTGITSFKFDQMGRPSCDTCGTGVTITLVGSGKAIVKIESEGYIHAN
ncbi:MAG: prepilin-type N-terminal cleavage/methylation domain-containing protein [Alteromonadaceae bacterium]|nr:prepilin-type N-terminal cleavage/methylation domain-containing protein [Alteromonadaceae bacterium]